MRCVFAICLAFLAAASPTAPEMTLLAYLGGGGTDDCDGITTDRAGDIYLACHSDSPDFPGAPRKSTPQSRAAMDQAPKPVSPMRIFLDRGLQNPALAAS